MIIEEVHRRLFLRFFDMAQNERAVSIYMIPIMAYVKKAHQKMEENKAHAEKLRRQTSIAGEDA